MPDHGHLLAPNARPPAAHAAELALETVLLGRNVLLDRPCPSLARGKARAHLGDLLAHARRLFCVRLGLPRAVAAPRRTHCRPTQTTDSPLRSKSPKSVARSPQKAA